MIAVKQRVSQNTVSFRPIIQHANASDTDPFVSGDWLEQYEQHALRQLGIADEQTTATVTVDEFEQYKYELARYCSERLGWIPWASAVKGKSGQVEIMRAIENSIRLQLDRQNHERFNTPLEHWDGESTIKAWFRIESGASIGKTKLAGGIASWMFDAWKASGLVFGPTEKAINTTVFKEIRADRTDNPRVGGRVGLSPNLINPDDPTNYIQTRLYGQSTKNQNEAVQGQHGKVTFYLCEEAVSIPSFVIKAIDRNATGGLFIVLLIGNPRTKNCEFHRIKGRPDVKTFVLSVLNFPNVVYKREQILGAASYHWVKGKIRDMCVPVEKHNPRANTFDFEGQIYQPIDPEFEWSILGVVPTNAADPIFFTDSMVKAAQERKPLPVTDDEIRTLLLGVDVARDGNDQGTVYATWRRATWCAAEISVRRGETYVAIIKEIALTLKKKGVTRLSIRIDAGGGFGSDIIRELEKDVEFQKEFDFFIIHEINFNAAPLTPTKFDNLITELAWSASQFTLFGRILNASNRLIQELTSRQFKLVIRQGYDVKRLTKKDDYKNEHGKSCDHFDGYTLSRCSEHAVNTYTKLRLKKLAEKRAKAPPTLVLIEPPNIGL